MLQDVGIAELRQQKLGKQGWDDTITIAVKYKTPHRHRFPQHSYTFKELVSGGCLRPSLIQQSQLYLRYACSEDNHQKVRAMHAGFEGHPIKPAIPQQNMHAPRI